MPQSQILQYYPDTHIALTARNRHYRCRSDLQLQVTAQS